MDDLFFLFPWYKEKDWNTNGNRHKLLGITEMHLILSPGTFQPSPPSGHCVIAWLLSDGLDAASPARRLAGFLYACIRYDGKAKILKILHNKGN